MNIDPQISQQDINVPYSPANDVSHDTLGAAALPESIERWSKLPKARGRQPRDPYARNLRFECRNVDDLKNQLHGYLEAPTDPVEHTTLEFVFPASSNFMVYVSDFQSKLERDVERQSDHPLSRFDKCAVSVTHALAQVGEPRDRMRRQKAIAKVCVEACEKADGYRYSFHNNWLSREDEACRFSYFCNDSTLNKGRAANEGAGSAGKKMRKPVYDCQGLIAIKFSQVKQSLEVHYKHIPLHKTYAERAPPPRKDSKRYKLLEIFDPESLPQKRSRTKSMREDPENRLGTCGPGEVPNSSYSATITAHTYGHDAHSPTYTPNLGNQERESADLIAGDARRGQEGIAASVPNYRDLSHPLAQYAGISSGISNTVGSDPQAVSLVSSHRSRQQQSHPSRENPSSEPTTGSLQNMTQTANLVTKDREMSELDTLKAKLEAAEQRIRTLESEKSQQSVIVNPSQKRHSSSLFPSPSTAQYPCPESLSHDLQPNVSTPSSLYQAQPEVQILERGSHNTQGRRQRSRVKASPVHQPTQADPLTNNSNTDNFITYIPQKENGQVRRRSTVLNVPTDE